MKINKVHSGFLIAVLLVLNGCGGGETSVGSSATSITGTFIDSPVEGLKYTCSSSGVKYTTNASGEYTCLNGDDVSFYIENTFIGKVAAQTVFITPYSLYPTNFNAAVNLARLLQSLDDDSNPSNGIVLDANRTKDLDANLSVASSSFESDVPITITLVSETNATNHLNASIEKEGGTIPLNNIPVANAGADQNVTVASVVALDANASSDINGNLLTYTWEITSKPAGSTTVLSNTTIRNPTITPDTYGDYVMKLVVNDGTIDSMADTVLVRASLKLRTVLYDELNDFNSTIWAMSDWSNGNPFYSGWCPSQITFSDSNLTIKLEQIACNGSANAAGEYRTVDHNYTYGKYTARFQASDLNGTISSFFTYTGASDGTVWDEIDIEILGKDATKMQINYWRNGVEHPVTLDLGFNAADSFHTYSFIWHSDYIKWYVDDTLVYTVNENHLSDNDSLPITPSRIIVNLWAGTGIDSWSGTYDGISSVQTHYDYIKYEAFD